MAEPIDELFPPEEAEPEEVEPEVDAPERPLVLDRGDFDEEPKRGEEKEPDTRSLREREADMSFAERQQRWEDAGESGERPGRIASDEDRALAQQERETAGEEKGDEKGEDLAQVIREAAEKVVEAFKEKGEEGGGMEGVSESIDMLIGVVTESNALLQKISDQSGEKNVGTYGA